MRPEYEAVIGLEVHAQLKTASKIFCGCATTFGAPPNSQVCPVCLGMPGVLPVLNKRAVEFAVRMGFATNCTIAVYSLFARKNYFYPDLPKGYQISQYEYPLCTEGFLEIETAADGKKRIGIERIHLEEDAGKSVHAEGYVGDEETLIDANRCGVPLIEIVSRPDFRAAAEAGAYLSRIRQLVRYLDICDGNMEEGSLRCDANISLRRAGEANYGVKTELKNMNSIRNVEKAIAAEIARQTEILQRGGNVVQETLLWDEARNCVVPMRSKEFAHDYRYFPEPDLLPLHINERWREQIAAEMPELPWDREERFVSTYKLPAYDARLLTEERGLADFFEAVAAVAGDAKLASNWVMGDVLRVMREERIAAGAFPISAVRLGGLLDLIRTGAISQSAARTVFDEMRHSEKSAAEIVREKNLAQISDRERLSSLVHQVLRAHPDEAARFRAGEAKLAGFFVGKVMRETRGKANPNLVNELLEQMINK